MSLALSMFGGMALPPTPMRRQSIGSPSSRNVRRPTTTPFSDATTAGQGVLEAVGQTCALSECQTAHNHALLQSQHCILCTAQWVVRPAAGVCSAAPAIHKHRLAMRAGVQAAQHATNHDVLSIAAALERQSAYRAGRSACSPACRPGRPEWHRCCPGPQTASRLHRGAVWQEVSNEVDSVAAPCPSNRFWPITALDICLQRTVAKRTRVHAIMCMSPWAKEQQQQPTCVEEVTLGHVDALAAQLVH